MQITATQTYTRQTPRKIRLVANAVKDLPLADALRQLAVIERRSTGVVLKTMRQAIANAMHNHGFGFADLALDNIQVQEGPRYRRFRAVSRGRAHGVIKRTSHVKVTLIATAQAPVQPVKKVATTEKVEAKDKKIAAAPASPAPVKQKLVSNRVAVKSQTRAVRRSGTK